MCMFVEIPWPHYWLCVYCGCWQTALGNMMMNIRTYICFRVCKKCVAMVGVVVWLGIGVGCFSINLILLILVWKAESRKVLTCCCGIIRLMRGEWVWALGRTDGVAQALADIWGQDLWNNEHSSCVHALRRPLMMHIWYSSVGRNVPREPIYDAIQCSFRFNFRILVLWNYVPLLRFWSVSFGFWGTVTNPIDVA